ncbi:hypothetical protein L207DRAFT_204708 [Hyaloscypha variabilis F]|uniref:Uncharacterized protein n=1 Tax=Hyaloscypha variabilis (strain UAMH 11265 / GT02V1 / F) TaxID=1149755 RepID=A0A2J6S5H5_HYAVF|nr:hypothetical protein L207DRAFT_204708 [Hyaloscypha variabilis F]
MKRVRRRAPVEPPANEFTESSLQVIPRSLPFLETSSNWVSQKAKPNIGRMLQHLFNQLVDTRHDTRHSLSLDEIENFEVLATVDQGLFHAGLAIASVYYDTGTSGLYHCQQTLKIVSRRLSDSYLQSSDETIGAVGLLLIHDTLTGAADNSSLHLYGLERMVDARGGLHFLPDRLRRTLSMIDTFYATTWNSQPRFPFMQPPKDLTGTLNSFPLLTNFDLKLLNLRTPVGIYLGVKEILQVLRILTGIRFADPVSVFNKLALSDAIYILEWQLLPTQDPLSALYHSSFGSEIPKAFRFAAFLYIDVVLREMHSVNIGILVRKLLESLQEDLGDLWQYQKNCQYDDGVLLWICFIGRVASTSIEEKQVFTQGLKLICKEKNFETLTEMEEVIDKTGPGLQSFSKQSAELWIEFSALRGGESSHVPIP